MYACTPVEHTADAGFVVRADSPEELLSGAGAALVSLVADAALVSGTVVRELEIDGCTFEEQVFNYLRELVFLLSLEGLVLPEVRVLSRECTYLRLCCRGGIAGESAPPLEMEIKAVTYHGFAVMENDDGSWEARFIVDI